MTGPSKVLFASTLIVALSSPLSAFAAAVMPDFAAIPAGWVTDRYEPHSFSNVGTALGRSNVLGIEISSAEGLTSRPSGYQTTFYNTQGRQHAITGGAGSILSADLYVPQSWSLESNGTVRTDMWGVMTDGTSVSDYPIIGFTNFGGTARYRLWDGDTVNGWVDLATQVTYDAWTAFAIEFTGSSYVYSIDGNAVYTDNTINGTTGFQAVIMQAYNFYGDPSLGSVTPIGYTAHWSNTAPVPLPPAVWLLASSILGLVGIARHRTASA